MTNKYIEMDKHFIKEKLDNDMICTTYVFVNDNLHTYSPRDGTTIIL